MISAATRRRHLIFGAVRASVVLDPPPAICFDLRGGSLEIMIGDARRLEWATSVPAGVARPLTAELVSTDPLGKRDRRALRDRIEAEREPVRRAVTQLAPRMAVGSSGTLESLAQMVAARRPGDTPASMNQVTITRDEFLVVHKEIIGSTAAERLRFPGLDARRVDLIVAGSMVLATAMDVFGFDQLTISEWALREGIVLDAVSRHHGGDWSGDPRAIRRESVVGLARRCNWAEAHARKVASLAVELFRRDPPSCTASTPTTGRCSRRGAAPRRRRARGECGASPPRRLSRAQRPAAAASPPPTRSSSSPRWSRWHRRWRKPPRVRRIPAHLRHPRDRPRCAFAAILRIADGLDRSREGIVDDLGVSDHAVASSSCGPAHPAGYRLRTSRSGRAAQATSSNGSSTATSRLQRARTLRAHT